MKAIWSGSLSFGLLNIPVNVYSAIAEHRFGFNILCGTCHTPLKNLRWCEHCEKEVAWENIVKGFKKNSRSYIVMTKEDIDALKPEKADTIFIKEFIDKSALELVYVENHYYMTSSKKKDKAFYLFAQALKKSKKVAIGQFIMHEKEHVAAISFYQNALLLTTLHYTHEIRTFEIEETKSLMPTQEELSLASLLIDKLTHKKFDLTKYKDTFVEKLKKALSDLQKGKKPKKSPKKVSKKSAEKTLAASLKASLKEEARA